MKKNILAIAVVAATLFPAASVLADAGTVNFTGEILDTACNVDVSTQNQTVVLGSYNKSEFAATGATSAAKKFDIVLKSCPAAVTTAKVMFDGTPNTTDSTLLAIDGSVAGAATGVAINLMTADKTALPLSGLNAYSYALSSTADNTLNFYAQYKSVAAAVTAGPANSIANFSVIYN